MSFRMWSGGGFGNSLFGGTKSYHNGGVEGSAFSNWYDSHLKSFFDNHGHSWHHGGWGGTKGSGTGGTKGSGTGGTGSTGTTTVRESLEWNLVPDPDDGGTIDNSDDLSGGFTQDTGNVDVTFSVLSTSGNVINEFYTSTQNTADIVADGNPVDPNSAFSSVMTAEGSSAEYELDFSDPVTDVSFRINDVDASAVVRVVAYDEDGNEIPITLTAGSAIDLLDTDTVTGADTADSTGPDVPSNTPDASVLVDIAGPVSRIVIEHDQDGPENSGIDVTDVYFDVTVDDDTCGSGSGGTKGSGTGGTWGGTKGSGSGGTKGSGSGGTKGSGTCGTKGSGSGGTKGTGTGGSKGWNPFSHQTALHDLPAYTGDDSSDASAEENTVYASSGTTSGGTKGPGLNDILALMNQAPDEDDPALKASASGGLFGTAGGGTGLF